MHRTHTCTFTKYRQSSKKHSEKQFLTSISLIKSNFVIREWCEEDSLIAKVLQIYK